MSKLCLVLFTVLSLNVFAVDRPLDIFKYMDAGDYQKVLSMIHEGVDVNIRNPIDYNNTLLIEASYRYRTGDNVVLSFTDELLALKADPNPKNNFGTNAMIFAVKLHPDTRMLEKFVAHNGDLFDRFYIGETLLHGVIENDNAGAIDILKYLLMKGLNVDGLNDSDVTPLMKATASNCRQYEGCGFKSDVIRELVRRGADLSLKDKYFDFDALKFAIDNTNDVYVTDYDDIEFLLQNGAVVDQIAITLTERSELRDLLRRYL